MAKTIKARYRRGVIEPLEKLDIEEGKELTVTISDSPFEWERDGKTKASEA
jgi:predicted DNA-binding antitoxin AbrB/MazE fold protein